MRNTTLATYTRFAALLTAVAAACTGTTYAGDWKHDQEQLAQMAELHDLHATFHGAISVHDPVNGDSPAESHSEFETYLQSGRKMGCSL